MRVYREVRFGCLEFRELQRVEPSIRVGFPTDALEGLDERKRKEAFREYAGRHLHGVCTRRDPWNAAWLHAAWDEAITLEAVLDNQSDRAYWERELRPERMTEKGAGLAVALIAPGTDVCGVLAETRGTMLRNLREALPLLAEARRLVGPPAEDERTADV